MSSKNKIIVVLGMHRSGTSAIARSLELLGVRLGDDLHPAGFDNPSGFWEDRECLKINEELLKHLGSSYDRLDFAWYFSSDNTIIRSMLSKAKQTIVRKLSENGGLWGFKDPRTCRLISFWREVFNAIECDVYYLIVLRNPLSVARSLAKRNAMPFEKTYLLWLQHVLPSVIDSAGKQRLVVDYDQMMEAPVDQISRISKCFKLPMLDINSIAFREYLEKFLDVKLRHNVFSSDSILSDFRAPTEIIMTYQLLSKASRDEVSLEDPNVDDYLHRLNDRLIRFAPAIAYANILENELSIAIAEQEEGITEREEKITGLNRLVANQTLQIDELINIVNELKERIARLKQKTDVQGQQIAAMTKSRSWRYTAPIRSLLRRIR